MLNIAGKIDQGTVAVYKAVSNSANKLNIPYVVVGASARDLVMHHGYRAPLERATQDVDFGIQVPHWDVFYALRSQLETLGFLPAKLAHRFYGPEGTRIDIVPFGGNQDEQAQITWPPENDFVMTVLGFREACENAVQVCLQETPELVIPVATPEGMILLKLIAWTNRPSDMRSKDASDIRYLLKNYEAIPAVKNAIYEDAKRMENYSWDATLAASNELGTAARRIARDATAQMINEFFTDQHKTLSLDLLITEMCGNNVANEYDRNSQLLQALVDGFMMRK